MIIVVFEENTEDFYPLINFVPQYELRIGAGTIVHHIQRSFPRASVAFIDRFSDRSTRSALKGTVVYMSARFIPSKRITVPKQDVILVNDGQMVGLVCHGPRYPVSMASIRRIKASLKKKIEIKGYVLRNIWDFIRYNDRILVDDVRYAKGRTPSSRKIKVIGRKKHVYLSPGAIVHEEVVIDVTDGPVIIDAHACIRPFSLLIGPCYIGKQTVLERAKVAGSTIGPICRISGEVEASIFQGYGNKHHEGFIGHSFIGEWVNLGAMTTNSDLKNTYGSIRIKIKNRRYDTGMTKLGCFIGDHTKTGIGTLIPTGAVIGSFVNFFGGGMIPQYVNDFVWFSTRHKEKHRLDKALETARIVMQRRNVSMTKQYAALIKRRYQCQNL